MAQRKKIIDISYHTDDDSGMYDIGELDFGLSSELVDYCRQYGKEELMDFIKNYLPDRVESFIDFIKNYLPDRVESFIDSQLSRSGE